MKERIIKLLTLSFILFFAISVCLTCWVYSQDHPNVKIPGIIIKSVNFNNDLGLYEVIAANNTIFYLTKDSKYAIFGNVIDTKTYKNLTDERKREVFKVDFKSLPLDDAIKSGSGKKKIAVFSSPFCPWCRKLHEELKKSDDFTVYNFIVPYGDPNILKTLFCMNNPKDAFDKAYNNNMPKTGKTDCEKANQLQKNGELMRKNFISSFPTAILENGKVINGYIPIEKIKEEATK